MVSQGDDRSGIAVHVHKCKYHIDWKGEGRVIPDYLKRIENVRIELDETYRYHSRLAAKPHHDFELLTSYTSQQCGNPLLT